MYTLEGGAPPIILTRPILGSKAPLLPIVERSHDKGDYLNVDFAARLLKEDDESKPLYIVVQGADPSLSMRESLLTTYDERPGKGIFVLTNTGELITNKEELAFYRRNGWDILRKVLVLEENFRKGFTFMEPDTIANVFHGRQLDNGETSAQTWGMAYLLRSQEKHNCLMDSKFREIIYEPLHRWFANFRKPEEALGSSGDKKEEGCILTMNEAVELYEILVKCFTKEQLMENAPKLTLFGEGWRLFNGGRLTEPDSNRMDENHFLAIAIDRGMAFKGTVENRVVAERVQKPDVDVNKARLESTQRIKEELEGFFCA
jgi:hypothetical protein